MSKYLRYALACSLVVFVGLVMFAGGFASGHFLGARSADGAAPDIQLPGVSSEGGTPANLSATFTPFWQAWDLVHQNYVDQPVDDTKLMQGAIAGLLNSLGDQHTRYMSPAEYQIAASGQSGEFEGIGAYVEGDGDFLRVVSPFPGSPAEKAGLLAGDLIIKVNGEDIAGIGDAEIIRRVRGPAGTTVVLTVQREGQADPLEFSIVRQKFDIPSVEGKMLDNQVAYVKINEFGAKTSDELRQSLKDLMAQKPVGLILDLRNNPGGYLETAINVTSQFIPDGVLMLERSGDGSEKKFTAIRGGLALDIPMVVLINPGSASASEIVAGAIQDRQRGAILGETSYGKGSVQTWTNLTGDNGAVAITIARWYTPNGNSIHKVGIKPDVEVKLTEEDHAAQRDPQLDAAVQLLLKK